MSRATLHITDNSYFIGHILLHHIRFHIIFTNYGIGISLRHDPYDIPSAFIAAVIGSSDLESDTAFHSVRDRLGWLPDYPDTYDHTKLHLTTRTGSVKIKGGANYNNHPKGLELASMRV